MQHVRFGVKLRSRAVHLPRLLHPPNGHCQTISAGGNCTAPPGASGQALRAQGICGSVEAMSAPRRSSYCLRMLVAVLGRRRTRRRGLAAVGIGGKSRHRLASARREEDLHRQRDHRRILQDRVRRRISSGRPGRSHPQIRRAGAGVRRRRQPSRSKGATRQGRRRHRRADCSISTSRWPTASDDANVVVKLVRDRDLYRTIATFYGKRAGPRDPHLARSAMPVRLSQERQIRNRAFRRASSRSTTAISSSSTAPMRNCCNRWGRSTTPVRCPGPCSTTMCRWDFSTSTTSTS